jgi:hypothetical protein
MQTALRTNRFCQATAKPLFTKKLEEKEANAGSASSFPRSCLFGEIHSSVSVLFKKQTFIRGRVLAA